MWILVVTFLLMNKDTFRVDAVVGAQVQFADEKACETERDALYGVPPYLSVSAQCVEPKPTTSSDKK